MDLKSDMNPSICFATTNGIRMPPLDNSQSSSSHIQSFSQLSGVSMPSENSGPNFVYQRKRLLKSPAPLPLTRVSANASNNGINFVYERRKQQRSNITSLSRVSAPALPKEVCHSAIRSQIPSVRETERRQDSHGYDVRDKVNKIIEFHSVDDSCSSSLLDMDIGPLPGENKIDDTDECSSSDDQLLSTKDLCISLLRSHGLLSGVGSNGSSLIEEDMSSCSGTNSRSCNKCGRFETAEKLLICDECEEAFHIFCCNSSSRKMPVDDWYCQSCFKKNISMRERALRKSSIITSEKGSCSSDGDLRPIALMLSDSEPYTTGVRVGKGFQAFVPEWSGPIKDIDVPEPVELEPSDYVNLPGTVSDKCERSNYIGNWVQCRQVIVGIGEGIDGTVCGKWRRAPLFEVQTDNWDCFRCVLWDPSHADCAVPQELETEEVLKQLKYVEMLRPRLTAKRRRLDICSGGDHTEDANCTGSTNASKGL